MTIQHGIPQGTIIGILLFLLYVHDLYNRSSRLSFILFADDTTILFSHPDFPTLIDIINIELGKVSSWFRANKLSLNSTKTKHMFFSRSTNLAATSPIFIHGTYVDQVHSTMFLGVTIDNKLSCMVRTHLTHFQSYFPEHGCYFQTSPLTPLFNVLLICILYNPLIISYLNYCNSVWARNFTL